MTFSGRPLLLFAVLGLAACGGGDDDPDPGVTVSACGVAAETPAAECTGLDQCGAGTQNFFKDPTCDNCPHRADSHVCEAGACRQIESTAPVQLIISTPAEATGAMGFTIATLNPIMADGSKVTCEKLVTDACARGTDSALNFTSSSHTAVSGGGATTGMVYVSNANFEVGEDRLLFVQLTEEQSGDGAVRAWACLEGLTVPLPGGETRLGVDLVVP